VLRMRGGRWGTGLGIGTRNLKIEVFGHDDRT
jgi:hypothetical protein